MDSLLIAAGLSEVQAHVYLYLLDNGESSPPAIAESVALTRSNAYKVLDGLQELGLVQKSTVRKKIVFIALDPSVLASLVAEKRNQVIALEQNVREAMHQLRTKYDKTATSHQVTISRGTSAMVTAYEEQAAKRETIYFVRTRADIPFLGFETMNRIRYLATQYKNERFGIIPDGPENSVNPAIDRSGNLTRTWIANEAYTTPVEWTMSGDELLIQIFEGEGRVIKINDRRVAEAFREIWNVIDSGLRKDPAYQTIPPHAKRMQ